MTEITQEEILENNTKLLRKSLLMPQQTKFEALKRILQSFIRNGVGLFNKWCQPQEATVPQDQSKIVAEQPPKRHIKYSFDHFIQSSSHEIDEKNENFNGSFDQSKKQLSSINEDSENSRAPIEQQSFEARFNKGYKRIKRDESQSSFQRESKRSNTTIGKDESQFYEAISFSVFVQMHKNILEARKLCKDRTEEEANFKCEEYLKYAVKVGSLATQSETYPNSSLDLNQSSHTRKQQKILRKKVQFEDESHQLYDLSKVYQCLEAEKLRRRQIRRAIEESKRREEEEKKRQIERLELEKQMEAKRREEEEAAKRKKQLQEEQQRRINEQKLLEEQEKKQAPVSQQQPQPDITPIQEKQFEKQEQNLIVDSAPNDAVELKQEFPQAPSSPKKQGVQQKKQQNLSRTPDKESKQLSQTPVKVNPFINAPAKTFNLQDLINNHKPTVAEKGFLIPPNATASPPRSNIFNTVSPVSNLFTGVNTQQIQPTIQPIQPVTPNIATPPILTPLSNAFPFQTQNSGFSPSIPSYFPSPANATVSLSSAQNHSGFSSSSSSGNILPPMPMFPIMQNQQFSKNLFMEQSQQSQSNSIFGGKPASVNSNPKSAPGARKKPQIRIS